MEAELKRGFIIKNEEGVTMKRNNQTIIITLLFAFLLSGLLMASSDRTHVHSFGEWTVTKSPTCVEVGEKERICVCGFKETQ